jgi:hypothetical protein
VCILSGWLLFDREIFQMFVFVFVFLCSVHVRVFGLVSLCVCLLSGWLPFDDEKHLRWFACYMVFLF